MSLPPPLQGRARYTSTPVLRPGDLQILPRRRSDSRLDDSSGRPGQRFPSRLLCDGRHVAGGDVMASMRQSIGQVTGVHPAMDGGHGTARDRAARRTCPESRGAAHGRDPGPSRSARPPRAARRPHAGDAARLRGAVRRRPPGQQLSPAAEWLLDNFHTISAAARDIRHDLPPAFYRRLPTMAADEFAGLPRVYAMAVELIGHSAGRLNPQRLHRFVTASSPSPP